MKTILTKTIILLLIATFALGCEKDSVDSNDAQSKPKCEIERTGTVTISNSSSNPYDIYVDGVNVGRLSGKAISNKIELNEGNGRALRAEQVSGFILYPTIVNSQLNVVRCSDYSWQIP